ncbi:MAG: alpha/beta hydrolase-fold protein [Nibricoccus sp.]
MLHLARCLPARITRFARVLAAALIALAACATARAATAADFAYRTYTDASGSTPYRIFTPRNYHPAARYPLVMFLHGSGERGTNNTSQLNNNANGALVFVQGPAGTSDTTYETNYPCFMIAPQSTGDWSEAVRRTHLRAIIEGLINEFSIDPDRIYVTGLSMGGAGTWDQLAQNPTRFAAGVPICGWGAGNYAAFKTVPLWVFHSENDPTVGVSGSDDAVNALRNNGGDPIYSRYATGGHGSWTEAYKNPHLIPWVMSQRRGTAPALTPALRIATAQHGATASLSGWTGSTASPTALTWVRTDLSSGTGSSATPGSVTGTTSWSADALPLRNGVNTFRIQATGTSFSSVNGGVTTFSDTIVINHTAPAGDSTAPTITLSTPTTTATYSTSTQPLTLTGTAADNTAVTSVTWANDRTALSGTATGTTSWSTPAVTLMNGANQLTLATATDAAGNTATTTLLVTYTGASPNLPPVVQAGADTSLTLPATLTLNGSAYDDGLPASSIVTTLWSVVSGPGTVTFGNELSLSTTASFSAPGTYVLRLTAGDGALAASDDLTIVVSPIGTARIRLDLGDPSTTTTGNWNNLTAIALNTEVANAIDSSGSATGVRIRVSSAFNAIASSGLTGSPLYPDSASRDYFYVQAATTGRLEFSGLRADRRYSLVLYASRVDPGDGASRTGVFTVGSTSVTLDPVGNTTQTATLADLTADSSGKIELSARAQNTSSGYALLGAVELIVTPATPSFASWISSYFPSAAGDTNIIGPDADPDHDGLSNSFEYALATRPDQSSASVWTTGRWTDNSTGQSYLTLTFRRAVGPTGLTVVAQTSSSLATWSSSTADVIQQGTAILSSDGLAETVTYRCVQPMTTSSRQFLRVHATTP